MFTISLPAEVSPVISWLDGALALREGLMFGDFPGHLSEDNALP